MNTFQSVKSSKQGNRDPFEAKKRRLQLTYTKELLLRAQRLRERVIAGRYDHDDLTELSAIVRGIRDHITGNDTRISEAVGLSSGTVSAIYKGERRPLYPNFMRVLAGAVRICEAVLDGSAEADPQLELEPTSLSDQWAAEWIALDEGKVQDSITRVVEALDRLCLLARGSNTAIRQTRLSEIQRAQLIAVLETALAMLKSPMVEVGLLRRLGTSLGIIGKRTIEQEAMSMAAEHGKEAIDSLINNLI